MKVYFLVMTRMVKEGVKLDKTLKNIYYLII